MKITSDEVYMVQDLSSKGWVQHSPWKSRSMFEEIGNPMGQPTSFLFGLARKELGRPGF